MVALRRGSEALLALPAPNPANENSAVLVYYQAGPRPCFKVRARQSLPRRGGEALLALPAPNPANENCAALVYYQVVPWS